MDLNDLVLVTVSGPVSQVEQNLDQIRTYVHEASLICWIIDKINDVSYQILETLQHYQ